jgi:uncharacterized protein HemX
LNSGKNPGTFGDVQPPKVDVEKLQLTPSEVNSTTGRIILETDPHPRPTSRPPTLRAATLHVPQPHSNSSDPSSHPAAAAIPASIFNPKSLIATGVVIAAALAWIGYRQIHLQEELKELRHEMGNLQQDAKTALTKSENVLKIQQETSRETAQLKERDTANAAQLKELQHRIGIIESAPAVDDVGTPATAPAQ